MTRRDVIITDEAVSDLYELDYAIREKFQAPLVLQGISPA